MNDIINQLVLEYKNLDNEKIRKKTLLNEIIVKIYENPQIKNITMTTIKKYNMGNQICFEEIINDLFIFDKIIDGFIPENYNHNFVKYLYGCIKNKIGKIYKKEQKYIEMVRIDQSQTNNDEDTLAYQIPSTADVEEDTIKNDTVNLLIQSMSYNIIHFMEHKGKKYNSVKLKYFKMFYTENMTIFFKSGSNTKELNHQQIFSAMNLSFLDLYMSEICRTPNEVSYTPLKRYSQLFNDIPSNDELKLPLESKVFLKYIEETTGKKFTVANVSTQRKDYENFFEKIREQKEL